MICQVFLHFFEILIANIIKNTYNEIMFTSKIESYFFDNEKKVNKLIAKILPLFCLVGPIIYFCDKWGFFDIDDFGLLLFSCGVVIATIIVFVFTRRFASKFFLKYIFFAFFEVVVFYLSILPGVDLNLGYLVLPLLAALYYSGRFSFTVNVVSYIVMIISFSIRAKSNLDWFIEKTISMTIEFLIWILVEYALVRTAKRLLLDNYKRNRQINNIQLNLISGFANLVEAKDSTTGHHIKRISAYVKLICEELKKIERFKTYLTSENIQRIVAASPLHDLGKIAIPDAILCKTSVLSTEEFNLIKQHPLMGDQLIRDNMSSIEDKEYIRIARDVALHHHEWWNGNGYPDGLEGRNIPLCARIISTADVLDALLSKRPYKQGYDVDKTFEIITSLAGIQFDPDIINVLPNIKEKIAQIASDDSGVLAEKYVSLD